MGEPQKLNRRWTLKRSAKSGAAAVLGVLLIVLVFRLLFVYTVRFGCAATAEAAMTRPGSSLEQAPATLTVLTYNVAGHLALLHGDHLEKVAALIRAHHPDVVALQEVHRHTWQARFDDEARTLARLTDMAVFFGPSYSALGGEFGNAVLTRGKIARAEVVALPSVGEPRGLIRAQIALEGGTLDFFVTHLAAWGRLGGRIRASQVRCLREQIRRAEHALVFCGDLNATPDAPEIVELLGGDLVKLAGSETEPTFPSLKRHLDYVLADPGWRVEATQVLHEGPSDHWPVLVTLSRTGAPQH